MTAELIGTRPAGPLYRIGHGPDPWAWPPRPTDAAAPSTGDNRFDDPDGQYRVLYASSQRLGAFVEVLGRFRPDSEVLTAMAAISDDPTYEGPEAIQSGQVPSTWARRRRISTASVSGEFAQLGHSSSLGWLHVAMASELRDHEIKQLDAATIRLSTRRLTQQISRRIFQVEDDGRRRFAGIAYRSRLGDEFENWAIFEPCHIVPTGFARDISVLDGDFVAALEILGASLVPVPG